MHPRSSPVVRLFPLALALACAGCSEDPAAPPAGSAASSSSPALSPSSSPSASSSAALEPSQPLSAADARMRARLAELAECMDFRVNPYANTGRAEHAELMRDRAAQADDLAEELRWTQVLSEQLVLAGDAERGAAVIDALLERIERESLEVRAEDRLAMRHAEAVAWMRVGEEQNCLCCEEEGACRLPIQGAGLHTKTQGAERALEILLEDGVVGPEAAERRWLANLAAMVLGRHPEALPAEAVIPVADIVPPNDFPKLEEDARDRGLAHVSLSGGAVLEDLDGDGDLDAVVSSWGVGDPLKMFRNDGTGHFEDVSEHAGLADLVGGLNLNHADYDGDGDVDLYVMRGAWYFAAGTHVNSLLRNRGDGTFEDCTVSAGVDTERPTSSSVWWDYDRDGDLDLFVANESSSGSVFPCELYQNDGAGHFTDVAPICDLAVRAMVKGCTAGDFDDDGDPDLYLSVLRGPNQLWRNDGPGEQGGWRFTEIAEQAGVTKPIDGFPTWFFDYDEDGKLDLLAASYFDFQSPVASELAHLYEGDPCSLEHAILYRNVGDGRFEAVENSGLEHVVLAMGANFADLDLDGDQELLFGTGAPSFDSLMPNLLLDNRGDHFVDASAASGFANLQKGHGIAVGDVDADGDPDVLQVMGGAYEGDTYPNLLYLNPAEGRSWIQLRLEGRRSNRSAIGTKIEIVPQNEDGSVTHSLHRVVGTGGSFGSSSLVQSIGLGVANAVESLRVRWPSGLEQEWTDLAVDRRWVLVEGEEPVAEELPAP